mmetsp:Transcript_52940/g.123960  ORF Transcript_52940/g.123960 Transcript_52940/m.123960 type:complete len:942 (-) Transcript_52940:161-2986(-)
MVISCYWEAAWSPKEERWFYQDRIAGIATWDRPPGCTIQLPAEPPARELQGGHPAKELPKEWERAWDATSSRHFYFNRSTGSRTWHPPKVDTDLWEAVWSKVHRRWFYCNALSGVLVEEQPPGCPFSLPTAPLWEREKSHEEKLREEVADAISQMQQASQMAGVVLPRLQHKYREQTPMIGEAELNRIGHEPPAVPWADAAAWRIALPELPHAAAASHMQHGSAQAARTVPPSAGYDASAVPFAAPQRERPYKPGDAVNFWSPARGEWLDAIVVIAAPMAPPEQPVIIEFLTPEGKCRRELTAGHEGLRPAVRCDPQLSKALVQECSWAPPGARKLTACPRGTRCPLRTASHLASEAHPFDDDYVSLCQMHGLEAEERSLRSLFVWLDDTGMGMRVSRKAMAAAIPLLSWLHCEHQSPTAPWEHMSGDSMGLLRLDADTWRLLDPGETGYVAFEPFCEWAAPLMGLPLRAPPWGFRCYVAGYEPPEPEPPTPDEPPEVVAAAPLSAADREAKRQARQKRRVVAQQQAQELMEQGRNDEAMKVLAQNVADEEAEDDAEEVHQAAEEADLRGDKRSETQEKRRARQKRRTTAQQQARELEAQGRHSEAIALLANEVALAVEEDDRVAEDMFQRIQRKKTFKPTGPTEGDVQMQEAELMMMALEQQSIDRTEARQKTQPGPTLRPFQAAPKPADKRPLASGADSEEKDLFSEVSRELGIPMAALKSGQLGIPVQDFRPDNRPSALARASPPPSRLPTKPVATLSVERAARPMDRAAPVPPPLGRAQTNPHQVAEQTGIPIQALRSGQLGIPLEDFTSPAKGRKTPRPVATLQGTSSRSHSQSRLPSAAAIRVGLKDPPGLAAAADSRATTPRLRTPAQVSSRRPSTTSSQLTPRKDSKQQQTPTWEQQLRAREMQWFLQMQEKQRQWELQQQQQASIRPVASAR